MSHTNTTNKKPHSLPTTSTITVTKQGLVAHVELSRPKQGNALNAQMWEDFHTVFNALAKDTSVRCIVLSGQGKFFCVGLDLKDAANSLSTGDDGEGKEKRDPARQAYALYNHIQYLQQSFTALEKCPQPIIACAHNAVIGGGIDLLCASCIRFCTKDAWFSIKEADIGIAADVGTLQRIGYCIGNASLVRELAYTARKMESMEALTSGFVSRVFETKEIMLKEALAMAQVIATKSPIAVVGTKNNLLYSRGRPVNDSLERMALWNGAMIQTDDMKLAAIASLTKSDQPEFSKL
jgi:delta(3,5)-delta(2,4)-dienoyl-CoA isomerase